MNDDSPNVVRVCFKGRNLFRRVVVVDSQFEVIGTTDDPVPSSDKSTRPDRDIGQLKRLDDCLVWCQPSLSHHRPRIDDEPESHKTRG